jgi:hypothetical protein
MNMSGNYWSIWASPDTNNDGIVDVPYNITGLGRAADNYPLTKVKSRQSPPKIKTTDVKVATVGSPYSVHYMASDPDTPLDQLVWSMRTNALWLDFNSSHVLYGSPANSSKAYCWVNISVTDGSYSDWTNFTIEVRSLEIEYDRLEEADLSMSEDSGTLEISREDLIGIEGIEPAEVSISNGDNFSVMFNENGALLIKPMENWFGTDVIIVMFRFQGSTVMVRMTLTVWPVNDAPTDLDIIVIGNLREGETIKLVGEAVDLDHENVQTLQYIWYLEGEGYIGSGKELDLELPSGTHVIKLRVADPDGAYGELTREVTVETGDDKQADWILIGGVALAILFVVFITALSIISLRPRRKRGASISSGKEKGNEWDDGPGGGVKNGSLDDRVVSDLGSMERDLFITGALVSGAGSLRSDVLEEFDSGSISPEVFDIIMEELDEM